MATDMQDNAAEHPVVISSESWTGGEAPPPKKSKFELWTERHRRLWLGILAVSLPMISVSQYAVVHHASFFALLVLAALSVASFACVLVLKFLVMLVFAWLNRAVALEAQARPATGSDTYVRWLLFVGFVFSFGILPWMIVKFVLGHL